MGIFKRLLGKEIRLENKFAGELVYPVLNRKKLKVGSTVIIPEDYAFVLGYDGKVLDVYTAGKVELNLISMPETVKKLKLSKPDKNGKFAKKIKVNGYYVNLKEFVSPFKTFRKMLFKDERIGYFKAKTSGEIILYVKDPKQYMKAMLTQYSYLKKGEGIEILNNFISEYLTNKIEKNNYSVKQMLSDTASISNHILPDMQKKFSKYGVEIKHLYVREFTLNRKLMKYGLNSYTLEELDTVENMVENIQENQIENTEHQNLQENTSAFSDYGIELQPLNNQQNEEEQIQEQTENQEQDEFLTKFYAYKDEDFYKDYKDNNFETTPYEITNPFGSIEENTEIVNEPQINSEQKNLEEIKENTTSVWGNYENWDTPQKTTKQPPKFVDLNLENLYDNEKEN